MSSDQTKSLDFLWPAGRSGVLLIHGLTGTPTEMRFVARGLHEAGFTVRAVQLAGHCGSADDLVATGWRDWYRSVDAAATELRQQVDHLFVAGLSMGALLALKLAIDRPDEVDGVGLYGTTFRYDGWSIPKVARLSFLLPLVCGLGIGRKHVFMETFPYGIKNERIRNWVVGSMLAGDSRAAGLPGNPWPSLAEFVQLSRHVRKRLGSVGKPMPPMEVPSAVAQWTVVATALAGVSVIVKFIVFVPEFGATVDVSLTAN